MPFTFPLSFADFPRQRNFQHPYDWPKFSKKAADYCKTAYRRHHGDHKRINRRVSIATDQKKNIESGSRELASKNTSLDASHVASATVTLSEAAKAAQGNSSALFEGYSTMLERVFKVTDRKNEPPVATKAAMGTQNYVLLTSSDRQYLAYAYQYADQNDIPLEEVDRLAVDMGHYRSLMATGGNVETKQGSLWNSDGTPLYFRMTVADTATATATRILSGQSASETAMDHGFIAFVLNPRGAGWTSSTNTAHSVSFSFLEKLINSNSQNPEASVNPDSIDAAYKNSLHWVKNQDQPILPPDGWNSSTLTFDTPQDAKETSQVIFKQVLDQLKSYPVDFSPIKADQMLICSQI